MASNKIDRDALRQKILSVEGLDNETRTQLLGLLSEKKRYGLVWEEKPEDVEEQLRENLPVLKEVEERRILSDDAESPNHILIEGDNLHALTALTYTHEGKVDVIYIDPPYNTGNKDFIYNDSFVDAEDAYRHSKWLSFMSKRLRIAKKLLSDRGVIFISIDDNEQANLKLLCDEVFGEKNFKSNSIIINNRGGRDYGGIAKQHEYIIVYTKNPNINLNEVQVVGKEFPYKDKLGGYDLMELRNRNVKFNDKNRPNLCYPFYVNPNKEFDNGLLEISLEYKNGFVEVLPAKSQGIQTVWRWGKEEKSRKNLNSVLFGKKNKNVGFMIVQKTRKSTKMQRSIWDDKEFVNERGTETLKNVLNSSDLLFSYPKSPFLISRVLELASFEDSLILDFFAGSGTTLHATMQLNAEDGGTRQCILVTNNENKICEEVTYERNKRVINGYTTPKGEQVEGLKSNNLRYYKVDFVERDSSMTAKKKLMEASTELLCIKQDLYAEKQTFGSIKLNPRYARYFDDGKKQMLIIYNTDAIESLVGEIEKMSADINIMTYVFSTNNYALDADFEDVADKVTLCALPAAIYNAYFNVLPKKVTPKTEEDETETIPGE